MSDATSNLKQAVADARPPAVRLERRLAQAAIIVPAAGIARPSRVEIGLTAAATAVAVAAAATGIARPSRVEIGLTAALYLVTGLGLTVGFHRLFTHRSFEAHVVVRILLGIAGSIAAEGALLFWVAEHREHHQRSDAPGDPHSPHVRGQERLAGLRGFWHAHIGWMLYNESTAWRMRAPDVLRDHAALFVSRWYVAWVLLGLAIPGLIAGLWGRSFTHAMMGTLWGGLVRMFLVHHATWSVNSLGHLVGRRPFTTPDRSRNNSLVALVTLGEGWHNNHHAFPSSARHGLAWWELDPSYAVIKLLEWLGLARNVKAPRPGHTRAVGRVKS